MCVYYILGYSDLRFCCTGMFDLLCSSHKCCNLIGWNSLCIVEWVLLYSPLGRDMYCISYIQWIAEWLLRALLTISIHPSHAPTGCVYTFTQEHLTFEPTAVVWHSQMYPVGAWLGWLLMVNNAHNNHFAIRCTSYWLHLYSLCVALEPVDHLGCQRPLIHCMDLDQVQLTGQWCDTMRNSHKTASVHTSLLFI